MENAIIIGILVILMAVGIHSSVKHFKGEGGCCGGGSEVKPRKKKLKNVIRKKIVIIEGMSCDKCKYSVERRINEIAGAAAVVNLRKKQAVVSMEQEISDEVLRAAVEDVGFEVVEIR